MDYVGNLNRVMDFSVAQRDVISNNIANNNTPGYKAQRIKWDETFNGLGDMVKTNPKHLPIGNDAKGFLSQIDNESAVKSDGNSVDMNKEIVEMMKNNQVFSLSVQAYNSNSAAKSAARGS